MRRQQRLRERRARHRIVYERRSEPVGERGFVDEHA